MVLLILFGSSFHYLDIIFSNPFILLAGVILFFYFILLVLLFGLLLRGPLQSLHFFSFHFNSFRVSLPCPPASRCVLSISLHFISFHFSPCALRSSRVFSIVIIVMDIIVMIPKVNNKK